MRAIIFLPHRPLRARRHIGPMSLRATPWALPERRGRNYSNAVFEIKNIISRGDYASGF